MFGNLSNVWVHVASFGRNRHGGIAVMVALLLPVLAGCLAIAIDLSRAANLQTELQDHADAAALAGATQLDQTDGSRARAIQAAAGALALAVNSQRFGDTAESRGSGGIVVDSNVTVADNEDITFLVDLETRTVATSDDEANFIEVDIQPREVSYFFAGLVGQVTEANPIGHAVAGYDQLICGIQPMMICNPNGGGSFNVAGNEGRGLFLKIPEGAGGKAKDDFISGEFGFLEVGSEKSNEIICAALGSTNPSPICLGTELNGKPGNVTPLGHCINARFNIYNDSSWTSGWRTNLEFQPDVNTVKGLIHDASAACDYNPVAGGGGGSSAWERPEQVGQPLYEGPNVSIDLDLLETMSYPRDTCAYNEGGCDLNASDLSGQTQVGDGVWDIDGYAYVQHGGMTGANLASAVVTGGYDKSPTNSGSGTDNISRKEVYDWEVGTGSLPTAADSDPMTPSACWAGGALDYVGSRRVITVAVIDCDASPNNKKGLIAAKPHSAIDIFLTEPVGAVSPNDVYAEIVGPAGNQNLTTTATNRVVLYE